MVLTLLSKGVCQSKLLVLCARDNDWLLTTMVVRWLVWLMLMTCLLWLLKAVTTQVLN